MTTHPPDGGAAGARSPGGPGAGRDAAPPGATAAGPQPHGQEPGSGPVGRLAAARMAARRRFGPQTTVGVGPAAKAVADDLRELARAEAALAQAELSQALKAKATGVAAMLVAAVVGWLALQGLLITAGLALALALPAWAAALVVSLALLLLAAVAGLLGKRKLATPAKVDTARQSVQEDIAWTKAHLRSR